MQKTDCQSERNFAMVGYQLKNTLSENGSVSRGICSYDSDRHLSSVVEHLNIMRETDGNIYGDDTTGAAHVRLNGSDLCSMNMWCFTPDYFGKSEGIFETFLENNINELKKEFYIPFAVDCMIKRGTAKCDVLSTPSRWFGVTYKEDRPGVVAKFAGLVEEGIYPSPLY